MRGPAPPYGREPQVYIDNTSRTNRALCVQMFGLHRLSLIGNSGLGRAGSAHLVNIVGVLMVRASLACNLPTTQILKFDFSKILLSQKIRIIALQYFSSIVAGRANFVEHLCAQQKNNEFLRIHAVHENYVQVYCRSRFSAVKSTAYRRTVC